MALPSEGKNCIIQRKYKGKKMEKNKITVAVGMSGGVDSSLVAYLLKEEGYNVIGITMKHWAGIEKQNCDITKDSKTCCSIEDTYDAKRVCDDLGILHYTINFEKEFKDEVINYFIDEYRNARTPNPCVICNRKIKLGKLVDFALKIGADFFATGHYSIVKDGILYRGLDDKKDQAYFLSQVKKEYFAKLMFPLGGMKKEDVRKLAEEKGVRVYSKRDSQEICFVENDDYKSFLLKMAGENIGKKGNIVLKNGEIVGTHEGLPFYTIGQRKGLGISYHKPLFVLGFNKDKNEIIVGDDNELFVDYLLCEDINLLGAESIETLNNRKCLVKTRSRDKFHNAEIVKIDDNKLEVKFIEKVRAVTPGQAAVFYDFDGKVLGSGIIV